MNLIRDSFQNATVGIGVADEPGALQTIHDPGCAAVVWRRQPLPDFQNWIDDLDPERLPKARLILRPEFVREAVEAVCDEAGTPAGPERDRLIDDAAALADVFAKVAKAPFLRLRLDVVTGNACRKFHIDALTIRLVCTYRGTGTQYGVPTGDEDPKRVFTVPTGSLIVLRGTAYPTGPKSGLLHRSPPIEGTGETRLVLVLDPIIDPDEEV